MRGLLEFLKPYVQEYFTILSEAFADINTFLNKQIESDLGSSFIIAFIITAPFIGAYLFFLIIRISG